MIIMKNRAVFKKLFCVGAAALMSISAALPAFADAEREFKEYTENEEMLAADSDAPTLSFDSKKFEPYVSVSDEGKSLSSMNIFASNDISTAYQGQSLVVNVKADKDIEGYQVYSWAVKDGDDYLYPDTRVEGGNNYNTELDYISQSIVLKAEDFGITYFDGGMVNFSYRFNPEVEGLLMDDSAYCYAGWGDNGTDVVAGVNAKVLKYNDSDSNNVHQYNKCVMTIPDNVGAETFVISLPVQKATDSLDIFYIDNLTITTKNNVQIKNLDNYNKNAKKQEGQLELKISDKKEAEREVYDADKAPLGARIKHILSIVGIVVVALAVIVGVVFAVIKLRKRFY